MVKPRVETLNQIRYAFEKSGIEFIDGGVRFRKDILNIKIFEGDNALLRLWKDMLDSFGKKGGETLVSGVREQKFIEVSQGKIFAQLKKQQDYNIIEKILICEGDTHLIAPKTSYRWVPADIFNQVPYFVYLNKYAIILWGPPTKIILIENDQIAENFRQQFYAHWNRGKVPDI